MHWHLIIPDAKISVHSAPGSIWGQVNWNLKLDIRQQTSSSFSTVILITLCGCCGAGAGLGIGGGRKQVCDDLASQSLIRSNTEGLGANGMVSYSSLLSQRHWKIPGAAHNFFKKVICSTRILLLHPAPAELHQCVRVAQLCRNSSWWSTVKEYSLLQQIYLHVFTAAMCRQQSSSLRDWRERGTCPLFLLYICQPISYYIASSIVGMTQQLQSNYRQLFCSLVKSACLLFQ